MKIFEVKKGSFINFDNVFKCELIKLEDEQKYFWRFFATQDISCSSNHFDSDQEARDWLHITLTRAMSAEEIINL